MKTYEVEVDLDNGFLSLDMVTVTVAARSASEAINKARDIYPEGAAFNPIDIDDGEADRLEALMCAWDDGSIKGYG